MFKKIIHSTVFKVTALMLSVSFVAIVSMFSTFFVSDSAQFDAQAVNIAGSLRMQSFRLASYVGAYSTSPNEVANFIERFERDLFSNNLTNPKQFDATSSVRLAHNNVSFTWQNEIKPMLLSYADKSSNDRKLLFVNISDFVEQVNELVAAYQRHAESNVEFIRIIQVLALFISLILISFSIFIIKRYIEQPLTSLTRVASQIERGNYTALANDTGKDELALLGRAINKMSAGIYRSQAHLEELVRKKTRKLSQSNESLDLLFQISRKLNESSADAIDYDTILLKLAKVTGVKDLDLCLMTAQGAGPYEHVMSAHKELPDKCATKQCEGCTDHETLFPPKSSEMKYQLKSGGASYGVLVVKLDGATYLEEWQHQLFESFAEQVANGLSLKAQNEQNRRMALLSERNVIARELHDSLAQALSYLKIQVTRLQRLRGKENAQKQMDNVVEELKSGLAAAYSELRELLTTFRLKLDGQGIKAALEQTISHLQNRSEEFTFSLNYAVDHVPFSPHEEIHLLQIAREATQNAFYHSKGAHIDINIVQNARSEVILTISDDGIGISDNPNKLNHYGLAIMQERSRNLEGELSIGANEGKGTKVVFRFLPEYSKGIEIKTKSA